MATLNSTPFPNNIRTVSGTPTLKQDDSVLMCDTSVAPVIINLLDIPANYWNTEWSLKVVDASSNASVNNITVNAPIGFLINGASSFVINSNGASLIVSIVSNTNFGGQYSVLGGSGSASGKSIQLAFISNADDKISESITVATVKGYLLYNGNTAYGGAPVSVSGIMQLTIADLSANTGYVELYDETNSILLATGNVSLPAGGDTGIVIVNFTLSNPFPTSAARVSVRMYILTPSFALTFVYCYALNINF